MGGDRNRVHLLTPDEGVESWPAMRTRRVAVAGWWRA